MLISLRIVFGVAFAYTFLAARDYSGTQTGGVDVINAMHVAFCAILGIANALVWAPYFGTKLSDPLTGTLTDSTYVEQKNHLLRLTRWLHDRGYRRLALLFCFLEGIHKPDHPTAFILGLKNARRGSWLEKVFAKEVFRFDNVQNCAQAYTALRAQGADPGYHKRSEVNLALRSLGRSSRPDPAKLEIPKAPPPPPPDRNPRVRLFKGADQESS